MVAEEAPGFVRKDGEEGKSHHHGQIGNDREDQQGKTRRSPDCVRLHAVVAVVDVDEHHDDLEQRRYAHAQEQ